jgi:aspartyl aminopeptidase
VLAVFNNEEVGSSTKQGAASGFLYDVLARVCGGEDALGQLLGRSFMVSADNAHARHPNRPDVADPDNAPLLNKGVVIKFNANQRYTTDGVSDAVFRTVCLRAGVPVQNYYNRADMLGGSTLGSISNTRVALPTVDIGLPQLAMHSAVETAGALDIDYMISALREFYNTPMLFRGDKIEF